MKYIQPNEHDWIEGRGYKKQILLTGGDLNCTGTLVQMIVIEPHTEVPLHHHRKMTEVFHIIEGTGSMTVGDMTYDLKPGDTLTVQPNESHNAVNPTGRMLKYIVFKTNVTDHDSYWSPDEDQVKASGR